MHQTINDKLDVLTKRMMDAAMQNQCAAERLCTKIQLSNGQLKKALKKWDSNSRKDH